MNGREALKALHNEMNLYMADHGIAAHQPIQFLDLRLLLSALAQSAPQPESAGGGARVAN